MGESNYLHRSPTLKDILQLCVYAKSLQSCPTLCDPMDCGLPGSSVHGDSPAGILESCYALKGNLPDPGIECVTLMFPALSRQVLYHQHHLGSNCSYGRWLFQKEPRHKEEDLIKIISSLSTYVLEDWKVPKDDII